MLTHIISRRLVPTLVAAGLTVALSTAFVAAQVAQAPLTVENVANSTALAAIQEHAPQNVANATGKPEDAGAEGEEKRSENSKADTAIAQAQEHSKGKGKPENVGAQGQERSAKKNENAQTQDAQTQNEESDRECPSDGNYANHGQFVSCVVLGDEKALSVLGSTAQISNVGALSTGELAREAAQSDVGIPSGATAAGSSKPSLPGVATKKPSNLPEVATRKSGAGAANAGRGPR